MKGDGSQPGGRVVAGEAGNTEEDICPTYTYRQKRRGHQQRTAPAVGGNDEIGASFKEDNERDPYEEPHDEDAELHERADEHGTQQDNEPGGGDDGDLGGELVALEPLAMRALMCSMGVSSRRVEEVCENWGARTFELQAGQRTS